MHVTSYRLNLPNVTLMIIERLYVCAGAFCLNNNGYLVRFSRLISFIFNILRLESSPYVLVVQGRKYVLD